MSSDTNLTNPNSTNLADPNASTSPLHEPAVDRMLNKTFTVGERLVTRRAEARVVGEHRASIASEILGAKLEQIRIARRTAENRWRLEAAAFLAAYSGELHRRVATQLEDIQASLIRDMGAAEIRLINDFEKQFEEVDKLPERFREGQRRRLDERMERHLKFIQDDLVNAAYERLSKIREAFPII